ARTPREDGDGVRVPPAARSEARWMLRPRTPLRNPPPRFRRPGVRQAAASRAAPDRAAAPDPAPERGSVPGSRWTARTFLRRPAAEASPGPGPGPWNGVLGLSRTGGGGG